MTPPLLLHPSPSPRLWGGTRLDRFREGGVGAGGQPLGELWLAYDDNVVASGPLAGRTAGQIAGEQGVQFVGTVPMARYGARVPLLAKLIDASEKLSIQVHPDDDFALEHEVASSHLGKSEAWYVLATDPGAVVAWGWNREMSAVLVRKAVAEGSLEAFMNRIPIAAGDVVYNPAGTVHAIGSGVFLFEIQQASDLTYRLYDYQRRGADGELRPLHLDKALAVADLSAGEQAKVAPRPSGNGWTELVRCGHFVLERLNLSGSVAATTSPSSLQILSPVGGHLVVSASGVQVEAGIGRAVVLPASLGAYTLAGDAVVLRSYVPGDGPGERP